MRLFSRPIATALCALAVCTGATQLSAQKPPKSPPPTKGAQRDTLTDSTRAELRRIAREANEIVREKQRGDTARRRALATAALPTAFADAEAQTLLERARVAREVQDSALRSYVAVATQRMTVGMGVRKVGLEKLLFRSDNIARIAWNRQTGVWITPVGSRMTVPMANKVDGEISGAISVPYFPGREALWLPSSDFATVKSEINERDMVHPFARGAEAYYKYATGDSIKITLPDKKEIRLRELRVTARKPDWRLFVGSFWFDRESGQLVRAAYRLSVDIDIWDVASDEIQLDKLDSETIEHLRDSLARTTLAHTEYVKDSTRRAAARKANKRDNDDEPPAWVKAMFRPATAKLDAITVEYGLFQGRFWLPRANSASASAHMGFMRVPFNIDEKYTYESVDGDLTLPPLPKSLTDQINKRDSLRRIVTRDSIGRVRGTITATDSATINRVAAAAAEADRITRGLVNDAGSMNYGEGGGGATVSVTAGPGGCRENRCKTDKPISRDSAQRAAVAVLAARRDSVLKVAKTPTDSARALSRFNSRRETQCQAGDSTWVRTETRYNGALRVGYRMPCDMSKLQTAPELPAAYTSDEELFDIRSKDELLAALDLSLQPAFAPQRPTVRTGVDLIRYNRVEGLSVGVLATEVLGAGYTLSATGRIGHADLHANGEVTLERSNSRRVAFGTVFHRLNAVNPEFGGALTFGSSLPAFLYTRDEGFYYRAFGAEVGERMTQRHGALDWHLFVERQYTAGDSDVVNTFSVGGAFANRHFRANFQSEQASLTGVSVNWQRAYGSNPNGFRLTSELHTEAATGTFQFGRGYLTSTGIRPLGPITVALTGAIGSSVGQVPIQRTWFLGGLRSVRGQLSGTQQGNAFWLTRYEVGMRSGGARPIAFFDAGWAGNRNAFGQSKAQKGAGLGMGFLDGLFRVDVSRGIFPLKRWRTDLYLEAPL